MAAFDPDKFLAETGGDPTDVKENFDPDKFLADTDPSKGRISDADFGLVNKPGGPSFMDEAKDPGAYSAFLRNIGPNVPVAGPAGKALGQRLQAVTRPGDYDQNLKKIQDSDLLQQEDDRTKYPRFSTVGAVVGGLGLPLHGEGMPEGIGGSAQRIVANTAAGGADAAIRGEDDWAKKGLAAGAMSMVGEGATNVRAQNKILAGIPEEVQQRYVERGPQINAARPWDEINADLVSQGKAASKDVSQGSTESFNILKDSGYQQPRSVIVGHLDDAIDKIQSGGAYDNKTAGLLKQLKDMKARVIDEVHPQEGAGPEQMGPPQPVIPAEKVKNFTNQFKNQTGAYAYAPGEGKGTQYNLGIMRDAEKGIRGDLEQNVPGYKEHMMDLADQTRAYKGVENKLSDPTRAANSIRRIMRGKDPEGLAALQQFDQARGTNFAQEIPDRYTAEFFNGDNTRGSRMVNLGKSVGKAAGHVVGPGGSVIGEGVGAAVGAAQDVYGRKVAKTLLDLSQTPYLGAAGSMLQRAAQGGPQSVLAAHRWLLERMPGYSEKIKALNSTEGDDQ